MSKIVSDPPAMLAGKEEDMKTTIRIAPLDAALVLRRDGTMEVWLPHVHENPPDNAVAMSALMCAYQDDRMMRTILDAMKSAGYEFPGPPPEGLTPAGKRPDVQ
ncbi:MAG TPA: hypothetical protein VES90_08915 [Candidatus Eisenbacteria bacterium]|nr:hypothetical protein [Candidatus Eisenbacteria bacterium]